MDFKLPYGIRDNNLLTIDDVESGLACDCVCPSCNKQLIARKGNIKTHHFAHYKSEDCQSGLETVLHKFAKDIIANSKTFTTPILYYPNSSYEVFNETEIQIDSVKIEKKIGEFIPDIIIETRGKKLLIEIVVSNPVNWQKQQRIKEHDLPIIVVYAKYIIKHLFTKRDFKLKDNLLKEELLQGTRYKRWLHNPKIKKIKQNLKANYAESKQVKSFKSEELGYYNYVEDCPLKKKVWKGGPLKGNPYASIDYDCNSCNFCMSIDYNSIPHKKLINYNHSIPKTVHCLGYLKDDLRELIKHLR